MGATTWTKKDPPNYIARAHALLGRTVDAGRVWDVIAAARYLAAKSDDSNMKGNRQIHVAGQGPAGLIAAYAAILDEQIAIVTLVSPTLDHMDPTAPQFLNVLRVGDALNSLGLLAPVR